MVSVMCNLLRDAKSSNILEQQEVHHTLCSYTVCRSNGDLYYQRTLITDTNKTIQQLTKIKPNVNWIIQTIFPCDIQLSKTSKAKNVYQDEQKPDSSIWLTITSLQIIRVSSDTTNYNVSTFKDYLTK